MEYSVLKTMNGLAISPTKSKSSPVAIQNVDNVFVNSTAKLPCIHSLNATSDDVVSKDLSNQFHQSKPEHRQQWDESEIHQVSNNCNSFERRFKPHNVMEDEDESKSKSDQRVFTLPDAYFEVGEKVELENKPVCRRLHVDLCRQSSIFRQNISRSQKIDAKRNQRINYTSDDNETLSDPCMPNTLHKTQELHREPAKPRRRRIRSREESIFFQGKFGKTRLVFCPKGNLRSAIRMNDRHPADPRRNTQRVKANSRYVKSKSNNVNSIESTKKSLDDENMHWIQRANPISSPTKSPMSTVDLAETTEIKYRNFFDLDHESDNMFFSTILSQV